MFFYFQPVYLEQLGADPVMIGMVLGAAGIVMTVAHIPAGILSDKIGRKPLLLTSWSIGMVATWIMASAKNLPVFIMGILIYSISAFVMSPLNSYITAARGKLKVERVLTIINASYSAGAIVGPYLGGLIGGRLGLRSIYQVSGFIFIISTLIIFFIHPQAVEQHSSSEVKNKLQLDKRFSIYLVIVFIAMFATYLPQPLTAIFLQDHRGITVEQLGTLGSITSGGIVILNLALGSIPVQISFILAQGCVALFALFIWQGNSLPLYFLGYFLMGGSRAARILATAQTRKLVHQANMGLAYGITETVGTSAVILAPPIAGYLYDYRPTLPYSLSIILITFSLIASWVYNQSHLSQVSDVIESQ